MMIEFGWMLGQEIPRLRRYARALIRNSVQADDLLQSTSCAPSLKGISGSPAPLRHWLFALLHNQRVS
jgi:RNA polymerase sigma-70 factor (ECF subfamily)